MPLEPSSACSGIELLRNWVTAHPVLSVEYTKYVDYCVSAWVAQQLCYPEFAAAGVDAECVMQEARDAVLHQLLDMWLMRMAPASRPRPDSVCAICREEEHECPGKRWVALECGHRYHEECWGRMAMGVWCGKILCPLCRNVERCIAPGD